MHGVLAQELESALRLRRVTAHSPVFAHRVLSFRLAGHRRHPVSAISELNTQPTYTPVQRFKCGLSTALAWLGARVVCYAFLCMTLSFTTPRRFIPTLSRLKARSTSTGQRYIHVTTPLQTGILKQISRERQ